MTWTTIQVSRTKAGVKLESIARIRAVVTFGPPTRTILLLVVIREWSRIMAAELAKLFDWYFEPQRTRNLKSSCNQLKWNNYLSQLDKVLAGIDRLPTEKAYSLQSNQNDFSWVSLAATYEKFVALRDELLELQKLAQTLLKSDVRRKVKDDMDILPVMLNKILVNWKQANSSVNVVHDRRAELIDPATLKHYYKMCDTQSILYFERERLRNQIQSCVKTL